MKSKTQILEKKSKLQGIIVLLLITIAVYSVFKIIKTDNFGSADNVFSYFQQALLPSVAACGLYFIVVMGLFDFSIGANIVLSSIVGVLLSNHFGYPGFILGAVIVGTLIGLVNGIVYIKLRIPSIIVTIGLMIVYECIGALVASGNVMTLSSNMNAFGRAPFNIILALISFALAYIFLQYTKIGIYTYAIGSNESVAENIGIHVKKYKVIAFVLAGFFSGIMSILTVSYGGAMMASTNMASMSRSFTPLMGCFFALAFKKTVNPVISIFCGELIITMILNGLITIGIPTTMQNVVIGITLLFIIILTSNKGKDTVVK